jgi:flavin reductase (DIM6/NTAB) family NADH-FMN oxidoreductase RutF
VGDAFVLNCLGEEEFNPVMKHFLQRFPPGADRFEGIGWQPAAGNGCPVLTASIAHMECKVGWGALMDGWLGDSGAGRELFSLKFHCSRLWFYPKLPGRHLKRPCVPALFLQVVSRMETADHWVTYAEVVGGEVTQPDQRTAVHRRKVANYY